jgi:hypothetical protein
MKTLKTLAQIVIRVLALAVFLTVIVGIGYAFNNTYGSKAKSNEILLQTSVTKITTLEKNSDVKADVYSIYYQGHLYATVISNTGDVSITGN